MPRRGSAIPFARGEVDLLRDVGKAPQETAGGVIRRLVEVVEELQRRGA